MGACGRVSVARAAGHVCFCVPTLDRTQMPGAWMADQAWPPHGDYGTTSPVATTSGVEPVKAVRLIRDNDATHKHPEVMAWAKRNKRFHFHFTPPGASRLNTAARLFRDLDGKARTRGRFNGVNDLIGAVTEPINVHNADLRPIIRAASVNGIVAKVNRVQKVVNQLVC